MFIFFCFTIYIYFYLGVDRTAGAIRGRSGRVIDVVTSEMEKYESGEYTESVMESIRVLRDQGKYQDEHLYLQKTVNFLSFSYAYFC